MISSIQCGAIMLNKDFNIVKFIIFNNKNAVSLTFFNTENFRISGPQLQHALP